MNCPRTPSDWQGAQRPPRLATVAIWDGRCCGKWLVINEVGETWNARLCALASACLWKSHRVSSNESLTAWDRLLEYAATQSGPIASAVAELRSSPHPPAPVGPARALGLPLSRRSRRIAAAHSAVTPSPTAAVTVAPGPTTSQSIVVCHRPSSANWPFDFIGDQTHSVASRRPRSRSDLRWCRASPRRATSSAQEPVAPLGTMSIGTARLPVSGWRQSPPGTRAALLLRR
jgi:hypothetical protein